MCAIRWFTQAYQIVQFWIFAEKRLVLSLLLVHKVFNIHIEAGWRDAFGPLRGLLTFLKQQRQQGEQWVSTEKETQGMESNTILLDL